MKNIVNRILLAHQRRSLTAQLHHMDETRKAFDAQEPSLHARIRRIDAQVIDLTVSGRAARGW
jgi:hypothetical protein